jgi:solute carrier family 20 (sodium-dependent phosphate transporter)
MYQWIFICGIFFALYNAWGIGANDCANSFATSVGSKVLTLRQAVIIAAIFEFGGAVLMGSHVTDTVRKSIVDVEIFNDNPGALMYGMLCADLSSAIWLTLATYLKYPVSTTHSIIGAIVGFSLAFGGPSAVDWDKIGLIVLSWVVSPLIAGIFAFTIYYGLQRFVFRSDKSFKYTLVLFPVLTFFTFFINVLFIIYKGSPKLKLDEMEFWKCFLISFGISTFTALMAQYIYIPYIKRKLNNKNTSNNSEIEFGVRTNSYIEATVNTVNTVNTANVEDNYIYNNDESIEYNINEAREYTNNLEKTKIKNDINDHHENAIEIDKDSDELCSWIQIITACFSSFAHGSNDVANAIAPLATIYAIYKNGVLLDTADVPIWILVIGGVGIVIGLSTWGYKIIDRIGSEITKITPSRGFVVELAAATTVIIASRAEIPVSTTHCQVGSILGCGLTSGIKNIKWGLVKGILFSWLVTLPFTGFLSATLFSFGYYGPYNGYNQSIIFF